MGCAARLTRSVGSMFARMTTRRAPGGLSHPVANSGASLAGLWYGAAAALVLLSGCGTTRMTDTQRTATEQLLISNAIDQSVSRIDVSALAGKRVFLDAQYLDGTVD